MKPVVAIIGRPNVGKSTLFNRLIGRRLAIVADQPGVTRDRHYADATWEGRPYVLIDTGGFEPTTEEPILQLMREQSRLAIDEADVIVFTMDAKEGLNATDELVATLLRQSGKPVIHAVNKAEGRQGQEQMYDFYRLGVDELYPISAEHGLGIGEMMDAVFDLLSPGGELPEEVENRPLEGDPAETVEDQAAHSVRIAVIGRPNVGKSSFVNHLLGEERHLVSDMPGTTRDAIDTVIERRGRLYRFVDTAGIRRKRSISMQLERYSVVAALKGLDRSDVALFIMDATETVSTQDARVAAFAHDKGKAVIIVLNKWDLMGPSAFKKKVEEVRYHLAYLSYAPVVAISAKTGYGVNRVFATLDKVVEEYDRRVTTGELNRFLEAITQHHPPPSHKGRHAKLYFITQADTRPPTFVLSCNDPKLVHFSYRRFISNRLREVYGFGGVPLKVIFRRRGRK